MNDTDRRTVSVADGVTWYDAGVDLVVFNGRDGTYHALDGVGSDIWRALAREPRLTVIAAELRSRYEGDARIIDEDLARFVEHAAALGLLQVSGS